MGGWDKQLSLRRARGDSISEFPGWREIGCWELAEDDPRASPFDFRIQKPFDDLGEVEEVVAEAVALHDERAKSPATSYE